MKKKPLYKPETAFIPVEVLKQTLKSYDQNNKWKSLATVIKIESTREFKNSEKPTEKATRYYISSLKTFKKPSDLIGA